MSTKEIPSGRVIGANARAAKLSPERRAEIAKGAADQRWANKRAAIAALSLPTVLGSYATTLSLAGLKLSCAVINGPGGIQRVLSENSINRAILGSHGVASEKLRGVTDDDAAYLPAFVAPLQLSSFLTKESRSGPLKVINYLDGDRLVRGYDASLLLVVCDVWLRARGAGVLQKWQLARAHRVEALAQVIAQTSIVGLIDKATGYENARPQQTLVPYLELLACKKLTAWIEYFPDEFYENIFKLKGWVWPGLSKNRHNLVAQYTNDLIWSRMERGILDDLRRKSPKNDKNTRRKRLHQWQTDGIGHPLLSQHIYAILMFQRLAIVNRYRWTKLLLILDQVLPKQKTN